jgi:hypothetical protein
VTIDGDALDSGRMRNDALSAGLAEAERMLVLVNA